MISVSALSSPWLANILEQFMEKEMRQRQEADPGGFHLAAVGEEAITYFSRNPSQIKRMMTPIVVA